MDEFSFDACAEMVRQLNPRLRPRYRARNEKRIVVTEAEDTDFKYPDVGVFETDKQAPGLASVSIAPAPLQLEAVVPEKLTQHFIEIRDAEERELVTAIEILSPTNKRGRGFHVYLRRRRRYLLTSVHLLEIDLLRLGAGCPCASRCPRHRISSF